VSLSGGAEACPEQSEAYPQRQRDTATVGRSPSTKARVASGNFRLGNRLGVRLGIKLGTVKWLAGCTCAHHPHSSKDCRGQLPRIAVASFQASRQRPHVSALRSAHTMRLASLSGPWPSRTPKPPPSRYLGYASCPTPQTSVSRPRLRCQSASTIDRGSGLSTRLHVQSPRPIDETRVAPKAVWASA